MHMFHISCNITSGPHYINKYLPYCSVNWERCIGVREPVPFEQPLDEMLSQNDYSWQILETYHAMLTGKKWIFHYSYVKSVASTLKTERKSFSQENSLSLLKSDTRSIKHLGCCDHMWISGTICNGTVQLESPLGDLVVAIKKNQLHFHFLQSSVEAYTVHTERLENLATKLKQVSKHMLSFCRVSEIKQYAKKPGTLLFPYE